MQVMNLDFNLGLKNNCQNPISSDTDFSPIDWLCRPLVEKFNSSEPDSADASYANLLTGF